jgi:hypothetical protein
MVLQLQRQRTMVRCASYSKSLRRLVTGCRGPPASLCIWDLTSPLPLVEVERAHDRPMVCMSASPDGRVVATGAEDCAIKVFDVITGALVAAYYHEYEIRTVRWMGPDTVMFGSVAHFGRQYGTLRLRRLRGSGGSAEEHVPTATATTVKTITDAADVRRARAGSTDSDAAPHTPTTGNSVRAVSYVELQIGDLIGEGASGRVYRGVFLGMDVAIKDFRAFDDADAVARVDMMAALDAELRIMANVPVHENVVPLIGVCRDHPKGRVMAVMPLLDRGSLWDAIVAAKKQNAAVAAVGAPVFGAGGVGGAGAGAGAGASMASPLPLRQAVEMARQACAGIMALHRDRIVHRDIACRNLFLDRFGRVCVVRVTAALSA